MSETTTMNQSTMTLQNMGQLLEQSTEGSKNEFQALQTNFQDAEVESAKKEINMNDTTSILKFGVDIQKQLTSHADQMIGSTKNKDTGAAAAVMNDLMVEIRGLKGDDLQDPNWLEKIIQKIFGALTPLQKFIQQYESIESQIDSTVKTMHKKSSVLENDIKMLDTMYNEAKTFYHELSVYIEAGQQTVVENQAILKEKLDAVEDSDDEMMTQQELKDFGDRITSLERKVDDLKLTQAVTLQIMPQIRMTQDTDKGLVEKMITICNTTIPMWKTQIALAITQNNQKGATDVIKAANDATNEMLKANAAALKQNTLEAKREIERGIVDAETIRSVNLEVIATIEESVNISMEARDRRKESDQILKESEEKLKDALKAASEKIAS